MSDQQFESYQYHEQDISEEKTEKWRSDKQNMAEENAEKQQNRKKIKKRHTDKKDIIEEYIENQQKEEKNKKQRYDEENINKEYIEEQEKEEEGNPWHVRKNVIEGYIEEQQEEEEGNPWRVRKNVIEGYIEEQQEEEKDEKQWYAERNIGDEYAEERQEEEKTEKWRYDKENIAEEYIEKQQDDGQYEVQPGAASERSGLASRFGLMRQLQNQYKGFVAAASERSELASRFGLMRQLQNQYKEFVAAACFLSILPFPRNAQSFFDSEEVETQPQLAIGSAYFPLVGLLIALVACLLPVFIGPSLHLPSLVLAALLTVALVCLTGGLHLDGLMDTSDGLFSGDRRERKLEIMRDSHVGAFGVLGGICILLLKFAIFASLDPHHLTLALLIVLPLARWTMVLAIYLFPSARLTGLGVAARQTITLPRLLIAAIISLLIALVAGQLIGFAVWMGGTLVTIIVGTWIAYLLGGLTGDAYGALAETTEVVCLLMLVATW